jgi:hypothetical protein
MQRTEFLQTQHWNRRLYQYVETYNSKHRKLQQRAPANIVENIDTAVSSLNPYQQQRHELRYRKS